MFLCQQTKDTRNFMIILLIFVLAYAVSSESLLYPKSDMTLERLFHLPRKAYWQVFGELNLEEIEYRGIVKQTLFLCVHSETKCFRFCLLT